MAVVLVLVANSDQRLSQGRWAEFIHEVDTELATITTRVIGRWMSCQDVPYVSTVWMADVPGSITGVLRERLIDLGTVYSQGSIGMSMDLIIEEIMPASSGKRTGESQHHT